VPRSQGRILLARRDERLVRARRRDACVRCARLPAGERRRVQHLPHVGLQQVRVDAEHPMGLRRSRARQAQDHDRIAHVLVADLRVLGDVAFEARPVDELAHHRRPHLGEPPLVDLDVVGVAPEHHPQCIQEPFIAEVRQPGDPPGVGEHSVGIQCRSPVLVRREHGGRPVRRITRSSPAHIRGPAHISGLVLFMVIVGMYRTECSVGRQRWVLWCRGWRMRRWPGRE
jgi:hypothetical protein